MDLIIWIHLLTIFLLIFLNEPSWSCSYDRWNRGRIQDFRLEGAHLKKLRGAEGGAKNFGVFRVKIKNDFTPTNHILSNCGGRREKFWDISCEKSRFYAKKSYFFQLRREARKILGYFVWKITIIHQKIIFFPILGGRAPGAPPPGSAPVHNKCIIWIKKWLDVARTIVHLMDCLLWNTRLLPISLLFNLQSQVMINYLYPLTYTWINEWVIVSNER